MTDSIEEKIRVLRNEVLGLRMGRPLGFSDRYGQVVGLLQQTANVLGDIERDIRVKQGRCAECWHIEGEHVDDRDFTKPTTYNCQVKRCTCPAFVKQEK